MAARIRVTSLIGGTKRARRFQRHVLAQLLARVSESLIPVRIEPVEQPGLFPLARTQPMILPFPWLQGLDCFGTPIMMGLREQRRKKGSALVLSQNVVPPASCRVPTQEVCRFRGMLRTMARTGLQKA